MKNIPIEEVFTPGSPAVLTYIERPRPEKIINRGLRNKGIQIIVYGHSGSGKTTLLYTLLKSKKEAYLVTRCTKGMSIKDILYDGFSQLGSFYIKEISKRKDEKSSLGFKFGLDFFGFNGGLDETISDGQIKERIVEIQKNPNLLAKLFGSAECLWVIEDFHKLDTNPKEELSQIMKVFMDVSNEFPKSKIIAVGAVDTARQVVNLDKEMVNRVTEVNVPLMTPDELYEIIALGEVHLNVVIENEVQEKIVAYSSGLASVTHTLCSLSCENKNVFTNQRKKVIIDNYDLDYAVSEYINGRSDSLKSIYELAIKEKTKRKYESPIKILNSILKLDKINFNINEIATEISIKNNLYKSNNLRKYVNEFLLPERGEILKYNKNGDTYSFSTPFTRGYCHIQLDDKKKPNIENTKSKVQDDLLKKYLNDEFNKFVVEFRNEI